MGVSWWVRLLGCIGMFNKGSSMLNFLSANLSTILAFIGGLVSGIALTINVQKKISNRNRNITNQNNNTVNTTDSVKFIGGDDNSNGV